MYISDFGGALDHGQLSQDQSVKELTAIALNRPRDPIYFIFSDIEKMKSMIKEKKLEEYRLFEQKNDVFAMCSTIAGMVIQAYPYSTDPFFGPLYVAKPDLSEKLETLGGFNPDCAALIIKGLSLEYRERPSAKEIRDALKT